MVLTNLNVDPTFPTGIAHPIHLYGQHFYVVEIGYVNYTFDGLHVKSTNDIQCVVNADNSSCQDRFATVGEKGNFSQELKWRNVPDGLYNRGKEIYQKGHNHVHSALWRIHSDQVHCRQSRMVAATLSCPPSPVRRDNCCCQRIARHEL